MPFSHRYRQTGDPIGGTSAGTNIGLFPRNQEYTYSWRSRASREDLDDYTIGGNFGVVSPNPRGNLSDIIADRRRWANELNQVASGVNQDQSASVKVRSKTDTGHVFRTLKLNVLQAPRYRYWRSDGLLNTDAEVFYPPRPYVPNGWVTSPTQMDPIPPAGYPTGFVNPSLGEQQARLNQMFADMIPNAPAVKIGETIASLLRGEFPRIVGNISQLIRRGTITLDDMRKYAGGEYLNLTFGWTPLIRDIQSLISIFMSIDRLIYGETYRRSRVIKYPSYFRKEPNATQMYTSYPSAPQGVRGVGITGLSGTELQQSMTFDVRIAARCGSLARPGIGANDFVRKAEELNNKFGVWYPSLTWDLTPYSWLIDWFIHLGAAIENASAYSTSGSYPLDYAWATSVLRVNSSFSAQVSSASGTFPNGVQWKSSLSGSSLVESVAKQRTAATPFGFGVDFSGLTSGQIAILVALGLARVP